jgi:uncharacterized integral membrane protein
MIDDAGRGRLGGVPAHGSAGPVDPHADPVTDPGMRVAVPAEQPTGPVAVPPLPGSPDPSGTVATGDAPATGTGPAPAKVRRSRTGGLWVGLILSALVLLLLLVFILQNGEPVQISFFALEGVLPTGVALLLAAIAGILLVAIPGSIRILQLRRAARRSARPTG